MEKSFCFVDGTQINSSMRKLIRSHVMKGKNAGRTLPRPSIKLSSIRRPLAGDQPPRATSYNQEKVQRLKHSDSTTIARNLGDVFLTFSFPLELTSYSLNVIKQFYTYAEEKMYPSNMGLSFEDAKRGYLQILLADEAASHCSIALMEACNEFFFGKGTSSLEGMRHVSQAFTLINKRLQSNEALADSTLGIILMLIIQEQIRNEKWQAEIHYEGLKKMIELRGGLDTLERNSPLLLKICKTDVSYALQYDRPILFFRDRMSEVQAKLLSRGLSLDRTSAISSIRHSGLHPDLHEIVVDAISITALFNNIPPGRTVTVNIFAEIIVSICSRLVRFRPLQTNTEPESNIEAVYHIGLTIFMMTLFLQTDHRRIVQYDLVFQCFVNVLDLGLDELDDDLVLWLMFIGGIWNLGSTNGSWLVSKIGVFTQRLGLNRWEEVRDSISKFPWIRPRHDSLGRAVWDSVYQISRV